MNIKKSTLSKDVIKIDKNPQDRKIYLKELLDRDGLTGIKENPKSAYCALSLTSTPENLKNSIKTKQRFLMELLARAGITAYDPGSSPTSPDLALKMGPEEIYRIDKSKVVSSRYFVSLDLLPSTGTGVEAETARVYNRISVMLHDRKIRTSRMQPNRTIHLAFDDLVKEAEDFIDVFRFLQEFEPGIGFTNKIPSLLGFRKDSSVVDLEKEVYKNFPHLVYVYDGNVSNVKLTCENIELFS